ncbi:hypothetical protein NKR23_g1541 [Pleurostoma richardsiae]|uniref:Uncharacterized protein n=1 Tax=Pleurostoma richardsiae TaxID=41990 RepID=A0AA38VWB3_9PEZI|nr:hypothetical protein NKR23_g1541 [Pleurostoma richardsiae]
MRSLTLTCGTAADTARRRSRGFGAGDEFREEAGEVSRVEDEAVEADDDGDDDDGGRISSSGRAGAAGVVTASTIPVSPSTLHFSPIQRFEAAFVPSQGLKAPDTSASFCAESQLHRDRGKDAASFLGP